MAGADPGRDAAGCAPVRTRRRTATTTSCPFPTVTFCAPSSRARSASAVDPATTSTARVSLASIAPCSCAAAATAGSSEASVRTMRSPTASPASRRTCCTERTRSRATPSRASSGVTSRSSTTNPPDGRTATASWLAAPPSPWTTVSRVYSPSSSSSPPHTSRPSSSSLQSPALLARIAACTSLPSRGPAARALTVSRWVTPEPGGLGVVEGEQPHRLDVDLVGHEVRERREARAASADDDGQRRQRLADPQALGPCAAPSVVEQTSRARSMLATRSSSAAGAAPFAPAGQSGRCTLRPPVRPRQISSVVSGSSGAATAAEHLQHGVQGVEGVAGVVRDPSVAQNRSRERRTYQLVRASRNSRTLWQAPATS